MFQFLNKQNTWTYVKTLWFLWLVFTTAKEHFINKQYVYSILKHTSLFCNLANKAVVENEFKFYKKSDIEYWSKKHKKGNV